MKTLSATEMTTPLRLSAHTEMTSVIEFLISRLDCLISELDCLISGLDCLAKGSRVASRPPQR